MDEKKGPVEMALMRLADFQKTGAHLLIPSIKFDGLSPFHAPVVESVTASLNPADGDIYPHEKKGNDVKSWRLTGLFLQKLSVCAGIRWRTKDTCRTDDRHDRDYVAYQAVGCIAKPDGSEVGMKGEYDVDMEVIQEEIREQYANKAVEWEKQDWFNKKTPVQKTEYLEFCIRRDVMQKRKHKLKLAETGAKNRAIRALLGLKNFYTTDELKKPFVMVRIIMRPDYNDPDVKKAMLAAAVQSITGIYHEPAYDSPAIDAEFNVVPQNGDDVPPRTAAETPTGTQPRPEAEINGQDLDFQNSTPTEQISILMSLAKAKGYDLNGLPKPVTQLGDRNRLRFFQTLRQMPIQQPADGIPA